MTSVLANAVVSVDGFVAHPDDTVDPLFEWYDNGPVAVTLGDPDRVFHTSAASAAYLDRIRERGTAAVVGRRLFDLTDGWGGVPASGDHVVVVTHRPAEDWQRRHPDAPYRFVGDVAAAIGLARDLAGPGDVLLTGGDLTGQALRLGLVDELHLSVAPVVLGRGRPFFGGYDGPPLVLDDPEVVVGDRVVHHVYRVRHDPPLDAAPAPT